MASGSTPPPPGPGPTAFTSSPLAPALGPTLSAPDVPTASGPTPPPVSGRTASMPPPAARSIEICRVPSYADMPPPPVGAHADDVASHHKGEGGGGVTMREVWINEGIKIEPAQASQFITKTLQSHFPGPVHRFTDLSMNVQDLLFDMFMSTHRLREPRDEPRARIAWTNTAKDNFKHLLYNARRSAAKNCGSANMILWKEHGPAWMRREYWEGLCDKWAQDRWLENSAKAKANRTKFPETNVHMSGSVSFVTHKARLKTQLKRPATFDELFDETHKKKGTEQYVSQRAREVAESYQTRMNEKYSGESQRPELDPEMWVAASGPPKKGHVYGFEHGLGTTSVLSSCASSVSHATSPFTTPAAPGGASASGTVSGITPEQCAEICSRTMSQSLPDIISQAVSQTLIHMGFLPPRPPPAQQPHDHPGHHDEDDQDDQHVEDL